MRSDPSPAAAVAGGWHGVALGFPALRLAAVLIPLLAWVSAGIAIWHSVQAEAAARIEHTVGLLRENALRGFGTQEAILAAIHYALAGRPPAELHGDAAFHGLLADLAASGAPLISGVLVTDGASRIVSASWEFPARPADLGDRDYVRLLAAGGALRAVGEPVASRPMGWRIIPVARRGPPGSAGIVVSSFSPEALEGFYASVAETPQDVVALIREDGTLLARHPAGEAERSAASRPEVVAMLGALLAPGAGAVWVNAPLDGRRRFFIARRVGDWPVAVLYGADGAALDAAWRQRMLPATLGGLAAAGLLLALTLLAERGARLRHEQAESRAEAEAQLARAGRAASLGLLAAGLAHDVKNLVQAVQSGARLLERSATDAGEVRRGARLLADAAARGGRLVEAMLAFARGGAATEEQDDSFDLRATLAELAELLARTLGSGFRVEASLPAVLPPAHGDRAGFEAAVVNLAANARDAMPGGGLVTITAEEAVVEEAGTPGALRPGRYVVTRVADTGAGMDAATLARIGEPFFTTKPPGVGTGLGLATVRGFCARAGGAFRIESRPGHGTAAAIWLPAARSPYSAAAPQAARLR